MSRANETQSVLSEEDLMIQDTLSMTDEERLDLLVSLMVDRMIEDDSSGGELSTGIAGLRP